MGKICIIIIGIFLICSSALGAPVTPQLAEQAAATELEALAKTATQYKAQRVESYEKALSTYSISEIKSLLSKEGETIAYVLKLDPKGYIVISPDTDIRPVIAYSLDSDFPFDDTPYNTLLHLVLSDMENRLNALGLITEESKEKNNLLWEQYVAEDQDILDQISDAQQWGPHIATQWNQGDPYNKYCPMDPETNNRCVVGCVATAMAQIINYWEYPSSVSFNEDDRYFSGSGEIDEDHALYDFPSFDELNQMLSVINYYDEDDIAALNFAVGVSVRMKYTSSGSSADINTEVLIDKFGYSSARILKSSSDGFYNVLERDMKEGRPALLSITGTQSGHAIIADGYKNTGEYHLNFGWGGSYNDWYFLPVGMPAGYDAVSSGGLNIYPPDTYNSSLLAMGWNHYGQFGDGTTSDSLTPAHVACEVSQAAAGWGHSLFVKTDGTLWSMGYNGHGQLGDGTTTDHTEPVQVATNVVQVSAGDRYSLFLKSDGTLWAMGDNSYGQLGDGTTIDRSEPVQVATNVVQVAAGDDHTLFVKEVGTLWAMGDNSCGQLGDGTTTDRSTPVQVATDVDRVAGGEQHSLFVRTDGTLWAMGYNSNGELGDGTTIDRSTPVHIASGVTQIDAGGAHSLLVKSNGTLWAMGYNGDGQLGDGTTIDRSAPVEVAANVVQVATGALHSLFIKSDGTLWAMGYNSYGELGDGTTTNRKTPVQIASEIDDVTAGTIHSLFIRDVPDRDADGIPDNQDSFPDDPEEWIDTDGDGTGNNADLDDDDDEMPDQWEIEYDLDPLINDAEEDADGDGYSNIQEFQAGTKPNDGDDLPNQYPIADAGPDQTVEEGDTVTLYGDNSSDFDDGIVSCLWKQTAGHSVTLSSATVAKPTFVAPDVLPGGTTLAFQLIVTDSGGLQDSDTCIINVIWDNEPPVADAGADQTVSEGSAVTLDGSNSSDPDDGIVSYLWTQTAGTPVTFNNPNSSQTTFTVPDIGSDGELLTFQLTVTDKGGLQSTDSCIVNVSDNDNGGDDDTEDGNSDTADNDGSDDGGGGGGGGIFGAVRVDDVIGYHLDGITKNRTGIYMPVTNGFKALKGAQTHIEKFAPALAKIIREGFDALERKAEVNKEGLLYRIGTHAYPILGKIAEFYLDAVGSQELMDNAYSGTMIDVDEFNMLHKQGIAISPHIVKETDKE